jgi:histone H3/H4
VPEFPFEKLVGHFLQKNEEGKDDDKKVESLTTRADKALRHAADALATDLMERGNLAAAHGKRRKVRKEDIELVDAIQSKGGWHK